MCCLRVLDVRLQGENTGIGGQGFECRCGKTYGLRLSSSVSSMGQTKGPCLGPTFASSTVIFFVARGRYHLERSFSYVNPTQHKSPPSSIAFARNLAQPFRSQHIPQSSRRVVEYHDIPIPLRQFIPRLPLPHPLLLHITPHAQHMYPIRIIQIVF